MVEMKSKALISFMIFTVLFMSAWFVHSHIERVYHVHIGEEQDDVRIAEVERGDENTLNRPMHTPFRPREYIRKRERDVD